VAATGTVVTDEDRNRFGMLLDRALERGLLSPVEYDVRLGRLADATTVEEMTDIVTDFPAFQAQAEALANLGRKGRRATGRMAVPAGALGTTPAEPARRRVNAWVLLTIVILVLAAAIVVLLVTVRTVHRTPTGVVARTATAAVVGPMGPVGG
jgi:hypothetical protein